MNLRIRRIAATASALILLYAGIAALLYFSMPEPRGQFEYMVIGTASTAATVFALFATLMLRRRTWLR